MSALCFSPLLFVCVIVGVGWTELDHQDRFERVLRFQSSARGTAKFRFVPHRFADPV